MGLHMMGFLLCKQLVCPQPPLPVEGLVMIEGSLEVKLRQYGQMKSRDGKSQREEKSRREKIREEKESEERRCRCAKR